MMTRSRRKNKTLNREDLLSSLPDALVTHILSFLSTKDSVCTSVLSTRWKYLFASVPALSLCSARRETGDKFVKFVNNVLRVHNVSCIRLFRLMVPFVCLDPDDVYSWICAAVLRNARQIVVSISSTQPCPLPLELFTNQMLVDLKLTSKLVFGVIGTVCLPNLKTMFISECIFKDGDSAKRFFSSCPMLEDLTIKYCYTLDIKRIYVYVPSLKNLTIVESGKECEWELNVPNLEYIYCEDLSAKWFSASILKSLSKADIRLYCYDVEDDRKMSELVYKCAEVQFLALANDTMESLARYLVPLPMFGKLTTLKLRIYNHQGWKTLPTLLESSPCLELFIIQKQGDFGQEIPKTDKLLPKNTPLCFSRSLKEVQLYWFDGVTIVYDWLRYLSKNANVLEKLTVIPHAFEYALIRRQLLAMRRDSKTCEIV